MTELLVVRHGETDWNAERRWQGRDDPPLNERGRSQARELAETLGEEPPDIAYSSDLRRARETAEIVAARLQIAVRFEPGLRELDVGSWSGLTSPEIEERFPRQWARHTERWGTGWEDGETPQQMAVRAVAALHRIADAHNGERVLVVAHGGVIRALHAAAAGMDFHEFSHALGGIANCSVSRLACEGGILRALD